MRNGQLLIKAHAAMDMHLDPTANGCKGSLGMEIDLISRAADALEHGDICGGQPLGLKVARVVHFCMRSQRHPRGVNGGRAIKGALGRRDDPDGASYRAARQGHAERQHIVGPKTSRRSPL